MTLQNKELLWLLSEKNLSDVMTAFYNAIIGIGKNTKILQTDSPWDIDPKEYEGSEITKDGMNKICGFLELVKDFTKDETMFKEQFLEPIQTIAKMLEEFRNPKNSRRTVDLEGWIFSITKPTMTSQYGEQRRTISSVIPELQMVMSASVSKKSVEKTSSKYHQFTKCQPIGLVNRIHQVNGSDISKIDREVLLSEFNFLFTSFNDIEFIGSSIEMENFCEIESMQSEIKQHMGFSFVSFAKVIEVQGSLLYLEGMDKQTMVSFTIPNHYYENAKMIDPKKMKGKYVRFFGVKWYHPDESSKIELGSAEVFLMQEEENEEMLILEDFIGKIRLRSKMPELEVKNHLGKDIQFDGCIVVNNQAYYKYAESENPTCANFIKTISTIRQKREKFKTSMPRVIQEQIIDPKKMSMYSRVSTVKKSTLLYEILVDHVIQIDQNGEYHQDLAISKLTYPEEIIKRKIWQLKFLGIFKFNKHDEVLTNMGKKIIENCMKENLDMFFSNAQSMIELETVGSNKIPPSIVLKYLEENDANGFSPLEIEGEKTKMFWSKHEEVEDVCKIKFVEYQNKTNAILDAMREVRNPVMPQWISEQLKDKGKKMGNFIVSLLLGEMKKSGIVEQDQ